MSEACDIFRRAGDRWGLASALWRAADLGFARVRLEESEAALDEALTVVAQTGRDRWKAHTLAGLAELSAARGDPERAAALFLEARKLYEGKTDAAAVAHVEERLQSVAKPPQRARKGRATTPSSSRKPQHEGGTREHDARLDSR